MTGWELEKLQMSLQEQVEIAEERFGRLEHRIEAIGADQRRLADALQDIRLNLEGWTARLGGAWTLFLVMAGGFGAGLSLLIHWFK